MFHHYFGNITTKLSLMYHRTWVFKIASRRNDHRSTKQKDIISRNLTGHDDIAILNYNFQMPIFLNFQQPSFGDSVQLTRFRHNSIKLFSRWCPQKHESVLFKKRNEGLFSDEWMHRKKDVCRPNFFTEKPKRPFSAEFFRNGLNCLVRKDFQTLLLLLLLLTRIVKIWNNINNNNEDWFTSLHSLLNKHWLCQLLGNI